MERGIQAGFLQNSPKAPGVLIGSFLKTSRSRLKMEALRAAKFGLPNLALVDRDARLVLLPLAGEEPAWGDIGQFDEMKDRLRGDGAADLEVVPGSKGKPERLGQDRSAMLAEQILADLTHPACQVGLEEQPIRTRGQFFHRWSDPTRNSLELGLVPMNRQMYPLRQSSVQRIGPTCL